MRGEFISIVYPLALFMGWFDYTCTVHRARMNLCSRKDCFGTTRTYICRSNTLVFLIDIYIIAGSIQVARKNWILRRIATACSWTVTLNEQENSIHIFHRELLLLCLLQPGERRSTWLDSKGNYCTLLSRSAATTTTSRDLKAKRATCR
jgi:hypothetical protein